MNDGTIPAFEGRPVDSTIVKMSGSVPVAEALGDVVLGVDDCVQMVSMFRVTGVFHKVDEKSGNLVRVQVLKPVEACLKPIDDTDPNDIGVVRALPYTPSTGGQA